MTDVGQRVGAILKADDTTVYLFGYGIYEGDFVPESGIYKEVGIRTPRIKLDNGDTVFGYQCWWAAEKKIKDMIEGKEVEVVPVPNVPVPKEESEE